MQKTSIIKGDKSWIEGEAVRQLEHVSNFPGMLSCVGMPDIHPAKGGPNGAAFLSKEQIYPFLIGNDCGCGVGLWKTNLANDTKVNNIIKKLNGLDEPWTGDVQKWLADRNIDPTPYDASLGTPGFSNHFIEIQRLDTVHDLDALSQLGMKADGTMFIIVHSGSRGFGESIMNSYVAKHGADGAMVATDETQEYLKQNVHAMNWAVANRELCAHRVCEVLDIEGTRLIDICHNSVTETTVDGCSCWLHRKGAAPMDKGPIIIPGSRNSLTYVVQPILDKATDSLWSVAHGAGRKINRSDAKHKLAEYYRGRDLQQNNFGGRVICGQKDLLFEEAPECYKKIDTVVDDLVNAGSVSVIATLHPVVTFKTSERTEEKLNRNKKDWQQERKRAREAKHVY